MESWRDFSRSSTTSPSLHGIACDVDALAVYFHMAMAHELAGGEHGGYNAHAVDNGVEAAFEQADEVFAGVTLATRLLPDRCGGTGVP